MTAQPIIPSFQAVWNERNSVLKETEITFCQKIIKVVWDILSILILPIGIVRSVGWAVHFIAKKLVLPSAWFYPNQIIQRAKRIFAICCRNLHTQFEIQKHKIMTPDGVRLSAIHFRHQEANANTPTLIFYQSNASVSQLGIYLWLIEEAVQRHSVCNFVVFDYRGVGSSKGEANSMRELLIDGDTAFQFLRDYLHVPPHQIHWYGWSLGGAIATYTKAQYPECTGPLASERSFENLRTVGEHFLPPFLKPFFFWVPSVAEKAGWKLIAPYNKLKGKTLIVFHRKDQAIAYPASAHQAAIKSSLAFDLIELYQTEEQILKAQERIVDHHFEDLQNYYAAPGLKADQAIANFILPQPATPVK